MTFEKLCKLEQIAIPELQQTGTSVTADETTPVPDAEGEEAAEAGVLDLCLRDLVRGVRQGRETESFVAQARERPLDLRVRRQLADGAEYPFTSSSGSFTPSRSATILSAVPPMVPKSS